MKIEYLFDIVAIYNQKSLRKAADERGIAEMTIKKHLDLIELELGEKIYKSKVGTIELTDEGVAFYLYAVKALAEITGYKNRQLEKIYDDKISFGVDVNVFLGYIYICSKLIGEKYDVKFNILQLYKEDILEGVKDGKYDAGLIIIDKITKEKVERYNLEYQKICTRRPVVMVSENHPLAKLSEVSLSELEKYKRISLKNSFEEFYCFEHDIEIKYGMKRSNVVFKYIGDVLLSLRNSEFFFIGGINEDEEILLKGLKAVEITELKERVEVGYIYYKTKTIVEPIKAIVDIRETFKTIK